MSEKVLEFSSVGKSFSANGSNVDVLQDLSLFLNAKQTAAVVGPSGSGKTTLLSVAAGLEHADSGEVTLCSQKLGKLSEDDRALVRAENVGFVFQHFELIPSLSAIENIMVPAELIGDAGASKKAEALLAEVGLSQRSSHRPNQLSGGEKQRVALARAFINQPKLLFADEPTGNLDRSTASQVSDLLFALNKNHATALLIATHDLQLAEKCEKVFEFDAGGVLKERG